MSSVQHIGQREILNGTGEDARTRLSPLICLRFLAALWVVLFHHGREFLIPTAAPARDLQKVGYAGVALFFLLSGFVLAYNYLDKVDAGELRRGAFWRARLARVYPLYLLCLVATAPSLLLSDAGGTALRLGLLQAWHPTLVGAWNLPSWSLSAEAFFYLLLPFALPLIARLPRRALLPSFLALVLLALLPPTLFLLLREPGLKTAVNSTTPITAFLKYSPVVRLPDFVAGVVLGTAYLRLDLGTRLAARPWLRRGVLIAGLVSGWALVEARAHVPWELLHNGLFLVPFGLLLVALSPGEGTLARLMSYRVPVFLGEASYAVYLFHTPFHDWLKTALPGAGVYLDAKAFFPVYLLALLALASLLHLLVERPAPRWIRSGSWRSPLRQSAGVAVLLLGFLALPTAVNAQVPGNRRVPGTAKACLVVFLKKGCPCNVRCMAQLNVLANGLGENVPMEGVVVGAASTADAERYRAGLGAGFLLRPDPTGTIAKGAGAVCSLDLALVDRQGRVLKLWEGVGKRTASELESEIAQRLGRSVMFDGRRFSDIVQTGCRF